MGDGDVKIKIETEANLAGAKAAQAQLERDVTSAQALGKSYDDIKRKLDNVTASIEKYNAKQREAPKAQSGVDAAAGSASGGFFDKLKGLSFSTITAGIAGLGTAIKFAKDALREFNVEENALVKLDTALKNAGQSTSEYKNRLAEMAEEMSKATATDHTEWLNVFSRLTQFGADSGNIGQAADAVKNLSGLLGGDLQTSAMLVSKALQGNYDMFSRYGIVVKDAGSQTEKLNELFKQLAERGGGQMEAMAETLSGKWTGLKLAFDDFLLSIGRYAGESKALQHTLDVLVIVLNKLEVIIGKPTEKLGAMADAAYRAKISTNGAAEASEKYAQANEGIKKATDDALDSLKKLHGEQNKDLAHADKMDELREKRELMEIERRKKLPINQGGITEEQAVLMEANTRQKFADRKYWRKQNQLKREATDAATTINQAKTEEENEPALAAQFKNNAELAQKIHANQNSAKMLRDQVEHTDNVLVPMKEFIEQNNATTIQKGYGGSFEDFITSKWSSLRDGLKTAGFEGVPETADEFNEAFQNRSTKLENSRKLANRAENDLKKLPKGKTLEQVVADNDAFIAATKNREESRKKRTTAAQDDLLDIQRKAREETDTRKAETSLRAGEVVGKMTESAIKNGPQAAAEAQAEFQRSSPVTHREWFTADKEFSRVLPYQRYPMAPPPNMGRPEQTPYPVAQPTANDYRPATREAELAQALKNLGETYKATVSTMVGIVLSTQSGLEESKRKIEQLSLQSKNGR